MSKIIDSIQLRRGTQSALETELVGISKPRVGEPIWESDTNKLKIGNGVDNYVDLPYVTGSAEQTGVYAGYYYNGEFYEDVQHTTLIPHNFEAIYLDLGETGLYYWSGTNSRYQSTVAQATTVTAGVSKLYTTLGQNTDGGCTQKVVTDEFGAVNTALAEKVSVDINQSTECLSFL